MQIKASFTDKVTGREEKNKALAFEAAAEGIVLLENDGTLPVNPCRLALFGAGAAYTIKGGSGSGEVTSRHSVNAHEGLQNAGFMVTTMDWIERYDAVWKAGKEEFIKENRKKLRHIGTELLAELMAAEYSYPGGDRISDRDIRESGTDTCIYILSRQSGEGSDRRDEPGSFRLDGTEKHNILLCAERYERFILVINSGAPVDLSPLDGISGINAIVYMNQLGMEGGNALAAVLSGERTPDGRLAVTWPKSYADVPYGEEFGPYAPDENRAPYKEGIFTGYRYYDSFGVEPRYPFGYGLGYTSFDINTGTACLEGTECAAEVVVTNTGKEKGRETVQLYVSCPRDGNEREYQRLAAFGKTGLLEPGMSETLTLRFPLDLLSSYDEAHSETYLPQGEYIVRIGRSSRDTQPSAVMRLPERVVLSRHRSLCAASSPVCELKGARAAEDEEAEMKVKTTGGALPVLDIRPEVFATVTYDYASGSVQASARVERILNGFEVSDMVKFCAGTGLFGDNKGFCVPGAVGHTTADYLKQGIPNVELCDGPAGLRLQRRSTISRKGKIKAVDGSISLYEFLPPFLNKILLGNSKRGTMIYQYVTGFPVAAAVAQTWDVSLAEEIGRAVSAEMSEYGVRFWLAPALNIVRNPLCGRNYEYYSEDPLISGRMAAAVTRGVQETPGNYVTVKHFAANNQEENRYFVSSEVDERALREIYLRGFEIAVREGRPGAVMTAYNKINGVYCANSHDLCTDILRGEWGFDGLVMTDWFSTGDGHADEAGAIEAGVDLIMPGGNKVVKKLLKEAGEGGLSYASIRRSCARVLSAIFGE